MKSKNWMRNVLTAAGYSVPLLFSTTVLSAPEVQQQGAVSFVSGGVGETEMGEMKSMSARFPVELLFLAQSSPDRYLSQVKVQIKDNGGNVVLDTESQGPVLLAKMPSGRYSVSADSEGTTKRQTIQVTQSKGQRVVFIWNGPVDQ
jgi:hypothetical protein